MPILSGGLILAAIILYIWGDAMRGGLPKTDLFLASAAAAPVAAGKVITHDVEQTAPVRFFTTPLWEFTWQGADVFLTAPDALALASSLVLAIRFVAWAVSPFFKKANEEGEE